MKILLKIIIFLFFITGYAQNHYFDSIIKIKNVQYKVKVRGLQEDSCQVTVSSLKKKILFQKNFENVWSIDYHDFNHDGNPDIKLLYMGQNWWYELYLYDPKTKTFREVEGFIRFPDSLPLKANPKYYYSYHRSGCADMNWVSDLFRIDGFKTIQIGHLEGQGCDFKVKENPQTVKIYKVLHNDYNKIKLLKTLPYLKYVKRFNNKWAFDEKYWNRNYKKFE
jgi:hypothetical protein